jgi:hypothetical protein
MSLTYENYQKYVTNVLKQTKNNYSAAAELPHSRPPAGVEMTHLWRQRRPHQHLAFWLVYTYSSIVFNNIVDQVDMCIFNRQGSDETHH